MIPGRASGAVVRGAHLARWAATELRWRLPTAGRPARRPLMLWAMPMGAMARALSRAAQGRVEGVERSIVAAAVIECGRRGRARHNWGAHRGVGAGARGAGAAPQGGAGAPGAPGAPPPRCPNARPIAGRSGRRSAAGVYTRPAHPNGVPPGRERQGAQSAGRGGVTRALLQGAVGGGGYPTSGGGRGGWRRGRGMCGPGAWAGPGQGRAEQGRAGGGRL
jgi:hypothetical protein